MTASAAPTVRSPLTDDDGRLLAVASIFTVAVVLHGLDHLRRGVDAVSLQVFWAGTLAMTIEIAVVVLAAQRHRLAPLAATSIGLSLAAGYVVVHFLPARSWLSDSLTSGADVSPLSWAAASIEVLAALALAAAGLLVLRRRGGLESATRERPDTRPLAAGLTHPATLAMIGGNVVLLVGSVLQLAQS